MTINLNGLMLKNLFLTKTALGVYFTIATSIGGGAISLADQYDSKGSLTATDWTRAIANVIVIIASQGLVLMARVDANNSIVYTPRGIPGPDKRDLDNFSDSPDLPEDLPLIRREEYPAE